MPKFAKDLFGKLIGDKGYYSGPLATQLFEELGLQLITFLRSNMNGCILGASIAPVLRKRAIIETINDQFKNISQIEHSRHRSPVNFVIKLFAGLVAYYHQPKKPSLYLDNKPMIAAS